jgi:subtilase family serine protease
MGWINRPARAVAVGAVSLAMTAFTGVLGTQAAMGASAQSLAAVNGSLTRTTDAVTGTYSSPSMSVAVALAPSNQSALDQALAAVYNPSSPSYHSWLTKGQFAARFAPSAATRSAVAQYLSGQGLKVGTSASPFLVRASGSSAQVSAAFKTSLHTYQDPQGKTYFANSTAAKLPASMVGHVLGVVGLSNTVRNRSMVERAKGILRPNHSSASASSSADCEQPYPTKQQLFAAVNNGVPIPFGYGDGPGCQGLTPSQDNSIYGAPAPRARTQGAGVNLAVFELSAYQQSDIQTWAHTFYGPRYSPPLQDILVDGGPLAPQCPAGDTCPPEFNGYSGDIEVDADIETQLAIAPAVRQLQVYQAPNDFTGQTELDLWSRIAQDDSADAVSTSWSLCENDVGAGYAQAENTIFEQMALQGQSVFGASGDTGAFGCLRSDGTTIANVQDPTSQPWVTSVGGTSFERFNPGHNPHPGYPRPGTEVVWNVQDLCNSKANEGGQTGFFWCEATGAGGGGNSQFWGRPAYQHGPGVNNPGTVTGNGTTNCVLASVGTPCREVPDVSANADEWTPYAEYCTGSAATPQSVCATFSGDQVPPGWFGIGGTSLSSPLWSAIIADRDGFQRQRAGNANVLLYRMFRANSGRFFHDITGIHQKTNDNGLFPTRPKYDMATGIGTPIMASLITARV